jgi:hypothetical protein
MATLPRTEDEKRLAALAHFRRDQLANEERFKAHPWPFLSEVVYTLDQSKGSIRKYPGEPEEPDTHCRCNGPKGGGCISYRHHIVNEWYRSNRICLPKSRRMMMSWTMLACHYWLARYRFGSAIAIGSRKRGENWAQGSAELVSRIRFIHEHLPPTVPKVAMEIHFGWLHFPETKSDIIAIAQGADQLRQYTFTAILADELAFWEEAQATYNAAIPTIEGGGRLTALSSAHPGFFRQLCYDEVDQHGTAPGSNMAMPVGA